MATTMVHVRVDQRTKQRAAKTLAAMGISVSDAVRMLLRRVAAEKKPALRGEGPQRQDREGAARRRQGRCKAVLLRRGPL